jgi:hypothetical protein
LVEGNWTGYNASLERSILKKAKYLEEQPANSQPVEAPAQSPAPQIDTAPIPKPQPVAAPAPHAQPSSVFAEKLGQAWRKGN